MNNDSEEKNVIEISLSKEEKSLLDTLSQQCEMKSAEWVKLLLFESDLLSLRERTVDNQDVSNINEG